MTAEVSILNRAAIALAADSAATSTQGNTLKIYNTVDKLFQLNGVSPVGIMVYGTAEFCNVPWETIIKVFRKRYPVKEHPYLQDYATDFITFLTSTELFGNDHVKNVSNKGFLVQ